MDDIASYDGEKESNKEWNTTLKIEDHASAGEYMAFAYIVDSAGKETKVATTTFTVKGPSAESLVVGSVDLKKARFLVKTTGVTAPSGVKKVSFVVTNLSGEKKVEELQAIEKKDYYYA